MPKDPPQVWDLSDLEQKRRLIYQIQKLKGLHEVAIHPRKLTRTLKQNRYYWVAVAAPFAEWLRESQGDSFINTEDAHEMLKWKILGPKEIVSPLTGEVELMPARSRTLDTADFAEFVDKAAAWLAEFCEIIVLPPELFIEPKEGNSNERERIKTWGVPDTRRSSDRSVDSGERQEDRSSSDLSN